MTDQRAIAFGFELGQAWVDKRLAERQGERIFSFELARYPIEAAKKIRSQEHLSGDFPES